VTLKLLTPDNYTTENSNTAATSITSWAMYCPQITGRDSSLDKCISSGILIGWI